MVQDTLEAAVDPQTVANGYMQECETASASPSSSSPRPCSSTASPRAGSGPEFNEHGDAILADLGLDWDTIIDLKVSRRRRLITLLARLSVPIGAERRARTGDSALLLACLGPQVVDGLSPFQSRP